MDSAKVVKIEKLEFINKNKFSMYIQDLLFNAYNERHHNDINFKHKNMALRGFNRYTCRFEYPNKDPFGNIIDYTEYNATIVVRCASDGKDYLYDIIDIKK